MPYISKVPVLNPIKLVRQQQSDDCGIATAAMIVGLSYREAWRLLSPPPASTEHAAAYTEREIKLFNEIGWWASAQLVTENRSQP
jgi:hypothetical protein